MSDLATDLRSDIYMLKYSIGGTGFAIVAGQDWNVASVAKLYANSLTAITNSITNMTTRKKTYIFGGVIIMIDGTDASVQANADAYYQNCIDFINGITTYIGQSGLKFYITQIHPVLNDRVGYATVRAAQGAIVALDPTTRRLVDIDAATIGADGLHPDAAGELLIGQALVRALKSDI